MNKMEDKVTPLYLSPTRLSGIGMLVVTLLFPYAFKDIPPVFVWGGMVVGGVLIFAPALLPFLFPGFVKSEIRWILSRYRFQEKIGGVVWKKWVRGIITADAPKGYCPICDTKINAKPGAKTVCEKNHEFLDHDPYNALKESMREKALSSWESKKGWSWSPEYWEIISIAVFALLILLISVAIILKPSPETVTPNQQIKEASVDRELMKQAVVELERQKEKQREYEENGGDTYPYITPLTTPSPAGDIVDFTIRLFSTGNRKTPYPLKYLNGDAIDREAYDGFISQYVAEHGHQPTATETWHTIRRYQRDQPLYPGGDTWYTATIVTGRPFIIPSGVQRRQYTLIMQASNGAYREDLTIFKSNTTDSLWSFSVKVWKIEEGKRPRLLKNSS